jgi:hypothetical protein
MMTKFFWEKFNILEDATSGVRVGDIIEQMDI